MPFAVLPGHMRSLTASPGDRFMIQKLEAKGQLLVQDSAGVFAGQTDGLGVVPVPPNFQDALEEDERSSVAVLFETDSPADRLHNFTAVRDGIARFLFPVDENALSLGGGGEFSITVERARNTAEHALPAPLASIRREFRVPTGTARAYHVAKGETVQIIDVEGRQCSDFLAFRSAALREGRERFIDSTVTRAITAGAYPAPGLFDKFYDQDQHPLLRLVQDTVGRHDTFALACTARGYEERGFPGHANCSDNISAAMVPHGVAARKAWPAINFFFNTWIAHPDNRIRSDEAWSRAGDYVALEALCDLVCVSTACPDDVDPINGWNPTDIHVRIYAAAQEIPRAIAHRPDVGSEASLSEETAFHPRTVALTQRFTASRDLWIPQNFASTGTLSEYWACRDAVTVQDMSSLRKFDIMGPDAEALLQHALTRNVAKLAQFRGTYALLCDETGAVIDDGTLFRIAPQVFRWCCGSEESGRHLKRLAQTAGLRAWITSLHGSMPNLAVQGPLSRQLMRRIVFTQPQAPDIENLKWFGCTIARVRNRDGAPFMLTRTGFTGELGYEIFCTEANALEIWDAIADAGQDLGLQPMGLEALEILRIEAGLMSAGAEFGAEINALESGLGFAVDFAKGDFVGRDALLRAKENPQRLLAGLLLAGDEHPVHGDGVFVGERRIGTVTSGTRSPSLERGIGMARLALEYTALETKVQIGKLDGRMKRLDASVCAIPFVDPERRRPRSNEDPARNGVDP